MSFSFSPELNAEKPRYNYQRFNEKPVPGQEYIAADWKSDDGETSYILLVWFESSIDPIGFARRWGISEWVALRDRWEPQDIPQFAYLPLDQWITENLLVPEKL